MHEPTVIAPTRVLLVEDDDGDALLVEELLIDSGEPFDLVRAPTVAEALASITLVDCALVDLGLPDAQGLGAVERLRAAAPEVALVVLTGLSDRARGLAALAVGVQDYLVKGEVDGPTLARAIRYAVQRRLASAAARRLLLADQRQVENDRLARGLLPRLTVGSRGVESATCYRPGGKEAMLGGDFFDAVQLADGTVRAVIGDVCGHGPDEAAIGVALRIAWRALVLSGLAPDAVLRGVDRVLRHERADPYAFATVCDVTIPPTGDVAVVRRHGHHPPLLVAPVVGWLEATTPASPLGAFEHTDAAAIDVPLPTAWAMLLMTDGLHEAPGASGRLGEDGLVDAVAAIDGWTTAPEKAMEDLLNVVTEAEGATLVDDVALLWLGSAALR